MAMAEAVAAPVRVEYKAHGVAATVSARSQRDRILVAAVIGAVATLVWIAFFTIGLMVPTKPHREFILSLADVKPDQWPPMWDICRVAIIVGLGYIPTNLIFLCCSSAMVGCMGRIAVPESKDERENTDDSAETERRSKIAALAAAASPSRYRPAIGAFMWGFFIYLLAVSGTMIISDKPFAETTPEQYLRLAGAASLLAFVVGWNPSLVSEMVDRVGRSRMPGAK